MIECKSSFHFVASIKCYFDSRDSSADIQLAASPYIVVWPLWMTSDRRLGDLKRVGAGLTESKFGLTSTDTL